MEDFHFGILAGPHYLMVLLHEVCETFRELASVTALKTANTTTTNGVFLEKDEKSFVETQKSGTKHSLYYFDSDIISHRYTSQKTTTLTHYKYNTRWLFDYQQLVF